MSAAEAIFIPFEIHDDGDHLHACSMFAARRFLRPRERTSSRRVLFVWRKFRSTDDRRGINCAIFGDEGAGISVRMIRAADAVADKRWPSERHYTYVGPEEAPIADCFLEAGWRECGITARRELLILERPARNSDNDLVTVARDAERRESAR